MIYTVKALLKISVSTCAMLISPKAFTHSNGSCFMEKPSRKYAAGQLCLLLMHKCISEVAEISRTLNTNLMVQVPSG